jgi:septation ring formation regulator EzrA
MENVNMDQLKKEMENAPSMDEAINSIFGNDDEDLQKEMLALSKQVQLLKNGLTTPAHTASIYEYTYASLSTELTNVMDDWTSELSHDIIRKNRECDFEKYLDIVDNAVKNLAEILGDFISRYNEMGNDIPNVATKLKSAPQKLKKVIDAYARLHDDLNNARELAHQIVGMLGTDPDDFDQMVMKRVLENASGPAESAGDDDAQSAE